MKTAVFADESGRAGPERGVRPPAADDVLRRLWTCPLRRNGLSIPAWKRGGIEISVGRTMSVAAEHVIREQAAAGVQRRHRLQHGWTVVLALGDLVALVLSYASTYVVANLIAPPAVTAPNWLLILLAAVAAPVWIGIFTGYHLYENDRQRISVASFDEVGDIFHALLAGSLGFLLLAQVLRRLENWWIYSALEASLFLAAAIV